MDAHPEHRETVSKGQRYTSLAWHPVNIFEVCTKYIAHSEHRDIEVMERCTEKALAAILFI
jgi:hypothetical protein